MTSAAVWISGARTIKTRNKVAVAHLLGLFLLLANVTLPGDIHVEKTFGVFSIHAFDVPALIALIICIKKIKFNVGLLIALISLASGFFVAAANTNEPEAIASDVTQIIYLIFTAVLFSAVSSPTELKVIIRYISLTLWFSAVVELLMATGRIENPYSLRSSFSGSAVSDIGIGRLVTETHMLALVALSICVLGLLTGFMRAREIVLLAIPSVAIVALAGTRVSLLMIFVPIVIYLLYKRNIRILLRILAATLLVFLTVAILLIFLTLVNINSSFIIDSFTNIGARLLAFFSSDQGLVDQSSGYRAIESQLAIESIQKNWLVGLGFGATFMPSLVSDNSWLALYGPGYTHNTVLWILIKTGLVGLAGLSYWVFTAFRSKTTRNDINLALLCCFLAIASISIFWNVISNKPDEIVIGAVVGLAVATRKKEFAIDDDLAS